MASCMQRFGEIERRDDALVDSVTRVTKIKGPKAQLPRLLFFDTKVCPLSAIEPDGNGEIGTTIFLVCSDGIIFNLVDTQSNLRSLRIYVDAITVIVFADRSQTVLCLYGWSTSTFPAGLSADSTVFKITA